MRHRSRTWNASMARPAAEARRGHRHALVEGVQWRGDNLIEVAAFGGTLRVVNGTLELYDEGEFVAVPVGHWIVRYRGDHTEHWLMDRLALEEPLAELDLTEET
jgi:hypothetical protein